MWKNIAFMIIGGVAALTFALSCGDDKMSQADAQATCDCPEAEPPLLSRIRIVTDTSQVPAGDEGSAGAQCATTELLISGVCEGMAGGTVPQGVNLTLAGARATGDHPTRWSCDWDNTTANPVDVQARAYCLTPASN